MKRILTTEEAFDYLDTREISTTQEAETRDALKSLLAKGKVFAVDRDDGRGVAFVDDAYRKQVEQETDLL
jgi:hypothetical protein